MSTAEMLYKPEQGCRDGEGRGMKSSRAEIPPPLETRPRLQKALGTFSAPALRPITISRCKRTQKPAYFPINQNRPRHRVTWQKKKKTLLGKKKNHTDFFPRKALIILLKTPFLSGF